MQQQRTHCVLVAACRAVLQWRPAGLQSAVLLRLNKSSRSSVAVQRRSSTVLQTAVSYASAMNGAVRSLLLLRCEHKQADASLM
jgi:hypothetical protein